MNPLTNVKNIKKLSEQELRVGLKTSWHDQYKGSAWIFVGGLPYDLTEGDIICVFSQYGEIVNINLIRDKATGKSKGFCFLCYEDQRSTVLAVDNLNSMKLLGRTLRVDHVQNYRAPKDSEKHDNETRKLHEEGCAPNLSSNNGHPSVIQLPVKVKEEKKEKVKPKSSKKEKSIKKEKEKRKRKKRNRSSSESSCSSSDSNSSCSSSTNSSNSNSSSSSSSSESDSESGSSDEADSKDKKTRNRKNKKDKKRSKRKRKKKSKHASEKSGKDSRIGEASNKRRQLEEKIQALEKALNSVRSANNKQ